LDISFLEPRLTSQTASLAQGHDVVCSFVNDKIDAEALRVLHESGVKLIALRCAGFNHVDLKSASEYNIPVVRVPAYSPHAVAEHTVGLLLAVNRKIHKAHARVHTLNFSLDGLVGFDLYRKTVGVIGTGKIGVCFANIMRGFGCEVIAYDIEPNPEIETFCKYVTLDKVFRESDVLSLHVPLTPNTHHMLDAAAFEKMKDGAVVLNTSRGALIDTKALINALKSQKIGGAGLDVYEEEEAVFFQDLSDQILQDDVLARLMTFPNTIITAHQAFLTKEALHEIAHTTVKNIVNFTTGQKLTNVVTDEKVLPPSEEKNET